MSIQTALINAFVFDGSKTARAVDAREVESWTPGSGWLWVHLDRTSDETEPWLRDVAGLDPLAVEALLAEETRPRSVTNGDGLLVILRGVNLNIGADPEDMVAVRIWVDAHRIITLRARRLMAAQDLRASIECGNVPPTPGALLVELADHLIERMAPVLDELSDAVDQLEEDVLEAPSHELRPRLSQLRRQAISLRRFLTPQREVLARLYADRTALFSDLDRNRMREVQDRLTRYVEELDSARDRAAVTQEELVGRISDQMNKNMYVLSLVAGVFLPLGLLTGLLGINVGGVPGEKNDWAFEIVCVILVALAGVVLWLFRRMRLL